MDTRVKRIGFYSGRVILILRPEAGVLALAWLIGILAVIVGIFQLLLGLKFRKIGSSLKH